MAKNASCGHTRGNNNVERCMEQRCDGGGLKDDNTPNSMEE